MDRRRLYTLDAMRGVAAICVILFHLNVFGIKLFAAGYLAVDFFFILSGLVLAITYEEKLSNGKLRSGPFIIARIVRLYPMYFIGTVMGCALLYSGIASKLSFGSSVGNSLSAVSSSLLFMPDPWSKDVLFPLNPPAWTLIFEIIINLLFALFLVKLPTKLLGTLWLFCLLLLAVKLQHAWQRGYTANLGTDWSQFGAGILRVSCGFSFGIILKRIGAYYCKGTSLLSFIPVIILIFVLFRAPYKFSDIIAIGLIFPSIVWFSAQFELPTYLREWCENLGNLSYPLYATHFPIIFIVHRIALSIRLSVGLEIAGALLSTITIAAVSISIDSRVRRLISRAVRNSGMAPPLES